MDTPKEFDFDEMVALGINDPDEFDRRHQQLVNEFIDSIPDVERRERVKSHQSNLMQKLSLEKDDTQRFNKMVELFWEQFNKFDAAHQSFRSDTDEQEIEEQKPKESAKVIQLIPTEDS